MIIENDIKTTLFTSNVKCSERRGNKSHYEYVYHDVDILNVFQIGDLSFDAMYQTGMYFDRNDYDCPTNKLSLSDSDCTDDFLIKIDKFCEVDFDHMNEEDEVELIEELKEYCNKIESIECIYKIWYVLRDNQHDANFELSSLDLSDDLSDFKEDEDTGYLIKIK
ncbi:hypothetical protein [Moritella viscosa]|uniref:hypothetical protein n=1 Tax=Moritella viscosa TaxID=80854 RepID=UPI0009243985|nr:hypothetical protein [Moritella viscosa]SGZ02118.1 DX module [Moritella viscosa]